MQVKKRVIIGLPQVFGFDKMLETHLIKSGFEVINISFKDHRFRYKNVYQRAHNFLRKTLLSDKHFKKKLRFKLFEKEILKALKCIEGKAEFALLIRSDIYPLSVMKLIKEKAAVMAGYQWDGLRRFEVIKQYIPLFDRFFVFDKEDLNYPNVLPLTNFYYEEAAPFTEEGDTPEKSVFFVGSFEKSRIGPLRAFVHTIKELGFRTDIHLFSDKITDAEEHKDPCLQFFHEHMPYEDYMKRLKKATIIVDFLNTVHQGLSFRTFEALGLSKKLVTNNKTVLDYDFYHPDNIFVIEKEDYRAALADFLKKPYYPVDPVIKQKYSFENWIHYVLDIPPYQAIKI